MSLKSEPSSEPLHISVKQLFLDSQATQWVWGFVFWGGGVGCVVEETVWGADSGKHLGRFGFRIREKEEEEREERRLVAPRSRFVHGQQQEDSWPQGLRSRNPQGTGSGPAASSKDRASLVETAVDVAALPGAFSASHVQAHDEARGVTEAATVMLATLSGKCTQLHDAQLGARIWGPLQRSPTCLRSLRQSRSHRSPRAINRTAELVCSGARRTMLWIPLSTGFRVHARQAMLKAWTLARPLACWSSIALAGPPSHLL